MMAGKLDGVMAIKAYKLIAVHEVLTPICFVEECGGISYSLVFETPTSPRRQSVPLLETKRRLYDG